MAAILGLIIAFSYYEGLADMLISRGHVSQWAQGFIFFLLFVLSFALIRVGTDYVVGANISFGEVSTRITAVIAGILTGMIISGVFVITIALLPVRKSFPYARFGEEINTRKPDKVMLNADGFVAGFFGWVSKGSLSCGKSFDALHPDYVDGLHLNRVKPTEPEYDKRRKKPDPIKVLTTASSESIILPKKYGVRIKDFGDHSRIVVKVGIKGREIADGGAADKDKNVYFALSQVRLICKAKGASTGTSGSSIVVYPDKYKLAGKPLAKEPGLDEVIKFSRNEFNKRGVAWIDIAFNVPDNMQAAFLGFKNNTIVELPKPVESNNEVERELAAEIRGESKKK